MVCLEYYDTHQTKHPQPPIQPPVPCSEHGQFQVIRGHKASACDPRRRDAHDPHGMFFQMSFSFGWLDGGCRAHDVETGDRPSVHPTRPTKSTASIHINQPPTPPPSPHTTHTNKSPPPPPPSDLPQASEAYKSGRHAALIDGLWEDLREIIYSTDPVKEVHLSYIYLYVCVCVYYIYMYVYVCMYVCICLIVPPKKSPPPNTHIPHTNKHSWASPRRARPATTPATPPRPTRRRCRRGWTRRASRRT